MMSNSCPHYDYGKSADKALGAYCTAKKKLVEPAQNNIERGKGCLNVNTVQREANI
jgi:hypothetical protein